MAMAATPPTTPPTMAPVLEEELEDEEVEPPVVTGREEVNVWVAWVVRVETWPAASVELWNEDRRDQLEFERDPR